ncbi:homoserine kinase [Ornithinimicrobium sediminis]|uniref:homoserine kinase n=1 Tax=Ornithinimicrobium sediminis TaxID=2904603 RepID=UPI001E451471|nr:homoserine kinase [Ornithinimicrobium sediminis]
MSAALEPGRTVRVSVPASSANLGPGFDTVGLALGIRDEYAVRVTSTPGLVVELRGEGVELLPDDEAHLVARAMREALEVLGVGWLEELARRDLGLQLSCHNVVPMSAGLGSSATAVVAGLGLGFALASRGPLTDTELALVNTHAGVWEGHPDNSSASVYGGLTVSWMPASRVVRTAHLVVHPEIEPVVLVPRGDRLSTTTARAVLPGHVPHADAVQQAGRAALLVHALTTDPTLLWDATCDWLHQEQRRTAYPASMAAVDTLRAQGHAAVVSGAGPSVLALVRRDIAEVVAAEVRGWGRAWKVVRPGIALHGLIST